MKEREMYFTKLLQDQLQKRESLQTQLIKELHRVLVCDKCSTSTNFYVESCGGKPSCHLVGVMTKLETLEQINSCMFIFPGDHSKYFHRGMPLKQAIRILDTL